MVEAAGPSDTWAKGQHEKWYAVCPWLMLDQDHLLQVYDGSHPVGDVSTSEDQRSGRVEPTAEPNCAPG